MGFSWQSSIATGLILAMSSTATVLQSLAERGLLKTSAGQSAFSVLLFQDIAVIPILAFLPLLAAAKPHDAHGASLIGDLPGWAQTLAVLAAVAAIVLAGRFLMRPLFHLVAGVRIREVFVGLALAIVVGIALLMQKVGLSAALGTFLAGVVLAESEYRHELEMDLEPFKGLLLAVFFITVGAGIDFSLLLGQPLLILGLVLGFILSKLFVLFLQVIAIDDREKALEIVETARRHFPKLLVLARAFDRVHACRLINAGVEPPRGLRLLRRHGREAAHASRRPPFRGPPRGQALQVP